MQEKSTLRIVQDRAMTGKELYALIGERCQIPPTAMSFVVKCAGADDPVVVECTFHPQVSRAEILMAGDPSNLLMPKRNENKTMGPATEMESMNTPRINLNPDVVEAIASYGMPVEAAHACLDAACVVIARNGLNVSGVKQEIIPDEGALLSVMVLGKTPEELAKLSWEIAKEVANRPEIKGVDITPFSLICSVAD